MNAFIPEPQTHYDGNDPHTYDMHMVLDPPQINDLPQNTMPPLFYIDGMAYTLSSYGEAHPEDGSRSATLKIYKPF